MGKRDPEKKRTPENVHQKGENPSSRKRKTLQGTQSDILITRKEEPGKGRKRKEGKKARKCGRCHNRSVKKKVHRGGVYIRRGSTAGNREKIFRGGMREQRSGGSPA